MLPELINIDVRKLGVYKRKWMVDSKENRSVKKEREFPLKNLTLSKAIEKCGIVPWSLYLPTPQSRVTLCDLQLPRKYVNKSLNFSDRV